MGEFSASVDARPKANKSEKERYFQSANGKRVVPLCGGSTYGLIAQGCELRSCTCRNATLVGVTPLPRNATGNLIPPSREKLRALSLVSATLEVEYATQFVGKMLLQSTLFDSNSLRDRENARIANIAEVRIIEGFC